MSWAKSLTNREFETINKNSTFESTFEENILHISTRHRNLHFLAKKMFYSLLKFSISALNNIFILPYDGDVFIPGQFLYTTFCLFCLLKNDTPYDKCMNRDDCLLCLLVGAFSRHVCKIKSWKDNVMSSA